jgi:hypothetical protein
LTGAIEGGSAVSRSLTSLWVALSACALGVSCDRDRAPTYPARGKVLFQGRPVGYATVVFHPVEEPGYRPVRPAGRVAADGSFTLTTYAKNDGAPAGDYLVTVEWRLAEKTSGNDYQPGPNRLPERYSRPETSGLRARIEKGSNELEPFQLTK